MVFKKILSSVWLRWKKDKLGTSEWIKSPKITKTVNTGRNKTDSIIEWKFHERKEIEMPTHLMNEALWINDEEIIHQDWINPDKDILNALTSISNNKVKIERQHIRRNIKAVIDWVMRTAITKWWITKMDTVVDIWSGWIRVKSIEKNRDIQNHIDINFRLWWKKFKVKWEIVWKEEINPWEFQYSIKFLDLPKDDYKFLDSLLAVTKDIKNIE